MNKVSLCISNYKNPKAFRAILQEWINFIGERPDEIVVVDGGTDNENFQVYSDLFKEGLIDKLFILNPNHPENNKDLCYIQEFWTGALSGNEYVMYIKLDTLPYRNGYENWLNEYKSLLDDPRIFSISGSYNTTKPLGEYNENFYYSRATSENFSIMKRKNFVAALDIVWEMAKNAWQCENPYSRISPVHARCLIEMAWDSYCEKNDLIVLARKENPNWTIFHTNLRDDKIIKALEKYKARKNIKHFMNSSGKYYSGYNIYLYHFFRTVLLVCRGASYIIHGNIGYLLDRFKKPVKLF
jgi:hypothetical protein